MKSRFFEKLKRMDWHCYEHAYGNASNLPNVIQKLISANREDQADAIRYLAASICHQQSVYSATPQAIPFLFDILQMNELQETSFLIWLLAYIAQSCTFNEETTLNQKFPKLTWSASSSGAMAYAYQTRANQSDFDPQGEALLELILKIQRQLLKYKSTVRSLCNNQNTEIKDEAIFLYSFYPEGYDELKILLTDNQQPEVLSTILLALSRFNENRADVIRVVDGFVEHQHNLVKFGAALALVRLEAQDYFEICAEILVECLIDHVCNGNRMYCVNEFSVVGINHIFQSALCRIGICMFIPSVWEKLLNKLDGLPAYRSNLPKELERIIGSSESESIFLYPMLTMVFNDHAHHPQLQQFRRQAIEYIYKCSLWDRTSSADLLQSALLSFGLPQSKEELASYF